MTIYLDIVFWENLLMNYIILITVGIVCKQKIQQIRLIISSALGSMYVISYYVTKMSIYETILAKIILSIVMITVAFNPKNAKNMFKEIIIFYLVSFAFGGCAFAIIYYIKPENIFYNEEKLTGIYPIRIAILGGIMGFFIINIGFKLVKNKIRVEDMYCNIRISDRGKEEKIRAMIDTGNFLKDPITNSPVLVVEKNSLNNILPKRILENTLEILEGKYEFKDEEIEYVSRFRVLPFSSLGKQNGMLLGFKVDQIETYINDEKIHIKNAIIGIYEKNLSNKNNYVGLIGLNCIKT